MAMSQSRLEFLLSQNETFLGRLQVVLVRIAAQVLVETGVGSTHAARAAYATYVLKNPAGGAVIAAVFIAQSTNVAGTITMEDEGPRTSVVDAALESQVSTDWSKLAGIDTGT